MRPPGKTVGFAFVIECVEDLYYREDQYRDSVHGPPRDTHAS